MKIMTFVERRVCVLYTIFYSFKIVVLSAKSSISWQILIFPNHFQFCFKTQFCLSESRDQFKMNVFKWNLILEGAKSKNYHRYFNKECQAFLPFLIEISMIIFKWSNPMISKTWKIYLMLQMFLHWSFSFLSKQNRSLRLFSIEFFDLLCLHLLWKMFPSLGTSVV